MSIAWATIVLVVLMLPGFVFFWGFYAPHQVTRETVPTSPLAQLGGVVFFSFFVHAAAYTWLNGGADAACRVPGSLFGATPPCIDFDRLGAMLRLDSPTPPGREPPALNRMLDTHAGWILAYFVVTAALSFAAGFASGKLVERGVLPIARHRYLRLLEEGRRQGRAAARRWPGSRGPVGSRLTESRLVRAHVLSRTRHESQVLIYDGVLRDFYAKADGTVSYVTLRGARVGTLQLSGDGSTPPRRSLDTEPLDAEGGDASAAFLVLTADDIANLYVEPLNAVTQRPDEAAALDDAVRRFEAEQDAEDPERAQE